MSNSRFDQATVIASVSAAIHRATQRKSGVGSRFAPRQYGERPAFAVPRRVAPGLVQNDDPLKTEGAGNTGCTLHPRSRVQMAQRKAHTSIQVQTEHSGIPCAMALRLISCSPRRPGFLATVTPEKLASQELDTSVGVSGPHVFAVRNKIIRLVMLPRPPHPAPTLVTMANAPLCGTGRVKCAADLGVRSIPTGCDISTRRANQHLARDGAVKREIFSNGAGQAHAGKPDGQISGPLTRFFLSRIR
jgi:hypothetical protein